MERKLMVAAVAALLIAFPSCSMTPNYRPDSAYHDTRFPETRTVSEAKLWLSWSGAERLNFVRGFFAGYWHGYEHGCDYLTPITQSRTAAHDCWSKKPANLPTGGSLADDLVNQYANSMTTYYKSYPEDDDVPITVLLENFAFYNQPPAHFHSMLPPRTQ
jgi:hypothetical protein